MAPAGSSLQGYLLSRPLPALMLEHWLRRTPGLPAPPPVPALLVPAA